MQQPGTAKAGTAKAGTARTGAPSGTKKAAAPKVTRKAVTKKAAAKKADAKKGVTKKTDATSTGPKKATKRVGVAKSTAPAKASPGKSAARPAAAKKAATKGPAQKVPGRKAPASKAPAAKRADGADRSVSKASGRASDAATVPTGATTLPDERWSKSELDGIRADLAEQLAELEDEYARALADLDDLTHQARDGAGDDQADAGTKTVEREQELSLAHNRFDLLTQTRRALARLDAKTYGRCESCGEPIAKARLQAFPAATLCVRCKQREERH